MPTQKLNYVFFNFGDKLDNYSLCNLAILSAKKSSPNARIIIYTDFPKYFEWLDFVEVNFLSKETLQEWKGKHNFLWRVKIKAIQDAAHKYDGHIIYMDSDIFVKNNLQSLINQLNEGACFMHLNEGKLAAEKAPLKQKMFKLLNGKTIQNIKFDSSMEMWNAGIVALPEKSKINLIEHALRLNDDLSELTDERWLLEQFSLSMALKNSDKLKPSDSFFIHYWGNKNEWLAKIQIFFSNAFIKNLSPEEIINQIELDEWKNIPINRTKRSFVKRLTGITQRYFPDRIVLSE